MLPPIEAYDAFASSYKSYAQGRRRYQNAINRIVISRARDAVSLLDAGAGDGSRTLEIGRRARIQRIVLVEPSRGMRAHCAEGVEVWPFSIQGIPEMAPSFEVITCLWNVLGHVQGPLERLHALMRLKRLLVPGGMLFLDVNHRYNGAAYGWGKTAVRMFHDAIFPSETNGDVIVCWNVGDRVIQTKSHLFTHAEMKGLFLSAGLKPVMRWVINYETGAQHHFPFVGQLLYQLTSV